MTLQMEKINSLLKTYFLSIVSRLIAIYFLWAFHIHVGFPPTGYLTYTAITYLALFVFFFALPLAKRLKLGKLVEFEAKVEQVRADIKEVRSETRELISTVSSVVNSISVSNTQSVVLAFPGIEAMKEAGKLLSIAVPESADLTRKEKDSIAEFLDEDSLDMNYALAHLRMDLERELRRITGNQADFHTILGQRGKFRSTPAMFHQLASSIPLYRDMKKSFEYVLQVCNAAIHGQQVPDNVAREAIDLGFRILRVLKKQKELKQ